MSVIAEIEKLRKRFFLLLGDRPVTPIMISIGLSRFTYYNLQAGKHMTTRTLRILEEWCDQEEARRASITEEIRRLEHALSH